MGEKTHFDLSLNNDKYFEFKMILEDTYKDNLIFPQICLIFSIV